MPTLTDSTVPAPITDKHLYAITSAFKMAGEPICLRVLLLLSGGERNVTALCAALGQSQPAISNHLALMRMSGLIEPRRDGKRVFYGTTEKGEALLSAVRSLAAS